ncbi:MAG: hypothetical protein IKF36_02365 [Bacilli bacterium]|nr:hypothetical protein [Bacilli bacterium]
MEKPKKKTNILAIILGVILVAVTTFGVLLYTGVVKSPMVKEKDCTETTTKKDDTKKTDTKTDTTKSADERYKEYITNLAASIKENYISDHKIDEGGYETSDKYNSQRIFGGSDRVGYGVAIKSNLELVYSYQTTDERHIADNVVSFYPVYVGNGGYKTLYYITTDGVVHSANLELHLFDNQDLKITDLDYKNIIEVKSGTTYSAAVPIFVDIDGNVIFRNN